MKHFKNIITIMTIAFSYIYRYSLYKKIGAFKSKLYTIWISREIKSVGNNCYFEKSIKLHGKEYLIIGNECKFGKGVIITAWDCFNNIKYNPLIMIGNNCNIGEYCHFTSVNKIEIGNNVLMGRWITISDNNHGDTTLSDMLHSPLDRKLISKGPIIIGDNVWIGDKATILGGVTIGNNAVIGANSVVTSDVPCFAIVGGIPAKILKQV